MAREGEGGRGRDHGREDRDSEFVDRLVHINRVAKVVKGGRRFGFAALVVAGGPMRAVFESLGVHDVVAKSQGSSNPYNMIRATFDALAGEDSPRSVAQRRAMTVATRR